MSTKRYDSGCQGDLIPSAERSSDHRSAFSTTRRILGIDLGIGSFGSWCDDHGALTDFDSAADCVSKIIALFHKQNACIVAVEKLDQGINWRRRRTGRKRWNYKSILRMLRRSSVTVVEVNPAGTSQHCPRCGARFNKAALRDRLRGRKYMYCPDFDCGWSGHSDIAAARIIARRAMEKMHSQ